MLTEQGLSPPAHSGTAADSPCEQVDEDVGQDCGLQFDSGQKLTVRQRSKLALVEASVMLVEAYILSEQQQADWKRSRTATGCPMQTKAREQYGQPFG